MAVKHGKEKSVLALNELEHVQCAICNKDNAKPIFTVPDLLLDRPFITSRFVYCCTCGLIYQNPRPHFMAMTQHYPPDYISFQDPLHVTRSPIGKLAVIYGLNKRARFITKHRPVPGTLLDIGCSTGVFLWAMRRRGWEVYGVEISEIAVSIAQQRYNLDVFCGPLHQAPFKEAMFDVITMWDVLEHIHDLRGTLDEIRRLLKPEGILIVRIPNFDSLDAKLFGIAWAGWDAPRHLFVFTPRTARLLLNSSGFEVIETSYAIGSYPTFVLSITFLLTLKRVPINLRKMIQKILLSPLFRALSIPPFYVIEKMKFAPLVVITSKKIEE